MFDDYKLYNLASLAVTAEAVSDYRSNKLEEISEYDFRNGTEYLKTLKVYFECNRNIEQTADLLFIHKNTAFYRVKRLQELFSIDFQNCVQTAMLICSLLMNDELTP
jgi:purine catabolism regulator